MKKQIKRKPNKPRLHIFRSNKHIYAQIINDTYNTTVTSSSSICHDLKLQITSASTRQTAKLVGQDIGIKLKQKGITDITCDRGNKIYHGRIRALVEGVREAGIKF